MKKINENYGKFHPVLLFQSVELFLLIIFSWSYITLRIVYYKFITNLSDDRKSIVHMNVLY